MRGLVLFISGLDPNQILSVRFIEEICRNVRKLISNVSCYLRFFDSMENLGNEMKRERIIDVLF